MSATIEMPVSGFPASAVFKQHVEWVSDQCQAFLDWQRKIGEATPEVRRKHQDALRCLLRMTRSLYLTVSDPENFDEWATRELRGRLGQLEESWRMSNHPAADPEAEALLARVFPG